jgi:chaperonin cofactor prefoldin
METSLMHPEQNEPKAGGGGRAVVWGVLLALAVGNIFAIWQSSQTQSQLEELNTTLRTRIATLNEQTSAVGDSANHAAAMLKDDVEQTRKEAAAAAEKAGKRAEQLVNRLANEHKMQQAAVTSEIGRVKDAATQANQDVVMVKGDVNAVKTDVDTVRGDVERTRTNLEATRAELQSVRGDLGMQSGLIATNAEELAALRELGERHFYEFDLPRDNKSHKIGSIAVVVKNTKPKRGKFTLDVIADDLRVEKKNRTVNEPVQFYVSGASQPYEIVVNEVKKNRIVGYLAIPRILRAAR